MTLGALTITPAIQCANLLSPAETSDSCKRAKSDKIQQMAFASGCIDGSTSVPYAAADNSFLATPAVIEARRRR